ncbi:MAG: hypothetical protein ABSC06_20170 [Rhodopila sp.]|jgi:hypothetical protein
MDDIDPDVAWKNTVRLARAAKIPVELVVEFTAESHQPGRKLRLFYDPVTDREGWDHIDN